MGGVDVDVPDLSPMPELQNDPIVAGLTPAAGFPTVRHTRAAPGQQHVMHRPIVLVATGERPTSVERGHEIDRAVGRGTMPIEMNGAVGPEARNPTVRKNV